ncbi:MAG: ATP-binding protein [Myxococcota bacterium]|nr:ATP-binding protein [Myxococcota bacterium]
MTPTPSSPAEPTLRSLLLRSRKYTAQEVRLLLAELGLDGGASLASLAAAPRAQLESLLASGPAPTAAGVTVPVSAIEAFREPLERVRLLLERYRLRHRAPDPGGDPADLGGTAAELRRYLDPISAGWPPSADLEALEQRLLLAPAPAVAPVPAPDAPGDLGQRRRQLTDRLALTPTEEELLWLLLAPELLPEFQWLCDGLLRQPTGGALPAAFLRALLTGIRESAAVEEALGPSSCLHRLRLVEHAPGGRLRVVPRVLGFLLGGPVGPPPELGHLAQLLPVFPALPAPLLPAAFGGPVLKRLEEALAQGRPRFVVLGPKGAGSRALAALLAERLGRRILEVRADLLLVGEPHRLPEVLREARLAGALLCFRELSLLATERVEPVAAEQLLGALAPRDLVLVLDTGSAPPLPLVIELLERLDATQLRLLLPEPEERRSLWSWAAQQQALGLDALSRERLRAFPLGIDSIEEAARMSRLTGRGEATTPEQTGERLLGACQHLVSHRLGDLATRVQTRATWKDLVVPPETRKAIDELISFARLSSLVLEEQGYGKKLTYGRGLSALFSGSSGTGKTMVAGLIAAELGVELFAVDLSRLVSKYIGETEQRLAELFSEAWAARAALLFDEADALFGTRTEVRSSTDRYANLEVNYLLQKMEEHRGIVLLTSNFPRSIDQAFLRRLRFKIHFPAPDAAARKLLWQRMIPAEAPRRRDLRLGVIAEEFELAGGAIRNAVLRAAFQAAADGKPLSFEHLADAAEAEYQEMGRLVRRER